MVSLPRDSVGPRGRSRQRWRHVTPRSRGIPLWGWRVSPFPADIGDHTRHVGCLARDVLTAQGAARATLDRDLARFPCLRWELPFPPIGGTRATRDEGYRGRGARTFVGSTPFGIGSDASDCDTESMRLMTAAIVVRSIVFGSFLMVEASFAIGTSSSP